MFGFQNQIKKKESKVTTCSNSLSKNQIDNYKTLNEGNLVNHSSKTEKLKYHDININYSGVNLIKKIDTNSLKNVRDLKNDNRLSNYEKITSFKDNLKKEGLTISSRIFRDKTSEIDEKRKGNITANSLVLKKASSLVKEPSIPNLHEYSKTSSTINNEENNQFLSTSVIKRELSPINYQKKKLSSQNLNNIESIGINLKKKVGKSNKHFSNEKEISMNKSSLNFKANLKDLSFSYRMEKFQKDSLIKTLNPIFDRCQSQGDLFNNNEFNLNLNYIFDSLKKIYDDNSHLRNKREITLVKFNSRKIDLNIKKRNFSNLSGIIDKVKLNNIGGSLFEINFDLFEFIDLLIKFRDERISIENEYKSIINEYQEKVNYMSEKEIKYIDHIEELNFKFNCILKDYKKIKDSKKETKINTLINKDKNDYDKLNIKEEFKTLDDDWNFFKSNLLILNEMNLDYDNYFEKNYNIIDDVCEECKDNLFENHKCPQGKWNYKRAITIFPHIKIMIDDLVNKILRERNLNSILKNLKQVETDKVKSQEKKNFQKQKY